MLDRLASLPLSENIRVVLTIVLAAVIWLTSHTIRRVIDQRVEDLGRAYALRKATSISLFMLFAFAAAAVWLRQAQGLSTILGLVGAGIAFSLQEVIASMAGWALVTWSRSYRVGDRIELGGIQGDVIDVGLIRTTLMETGSWVGADQQTGRLVTISNAYALRQPVFNYSAHFPYLWDGLKVPITYQSDWELAHRIVEDEVLQYHASIREDAANMLETMRRSFYLPESEAKPGIYLRFTDDWIELGVRYLVPTRSRRKVASDLSQRILRRLQSEPHIQIASKTLAVSLAASSHAGQEVAGSSPGTDQPPGSE